MSQSAIFPIDRDTMVRIMMQHEEHNRLNDKNDVAICLCEECGMVRAFFTSSQFKRHLEQVSQQIDVMEMLQQMGIEVTPVDLHTEN